MKQRRRTEYQEIERLWLERFGEPPAAMASPHIMRALLDRYAPPVGLSDAGQPMP